MQATEEPELSPAGRPSTEEEVSILL